MVVSHLMHQLHLSKENVIQWAGNEALIFTYYSYEKFCLLILALSYTAVINIVCNFMNIC